MAGATKRTELPTRWHDDSAFSVDWSPVCRSWGKATFREHVENGVRGLQEHAQHFWRYEGAAAQNMEDNRRSHKSRSPKSRPASSRPTGASATDDFVATEKMAALPPTSHRPVPVLYNDFVANAEVAALPPPSHHTVPGIYKTCVAAFDPTEYGAEYLTLSEGDLIEDLDAPIAAEGWAFGRLVLADGGRSEPGWYPHAFAL